MATTDTRELSLADLLVVDADSHVSEDVEEDLLPYMDGKHAAAKRFIEGADHIPSQVYSRMRVTPSFLQTKQAEGGDPGMVHRYDSDPETKVELMAEFDIDYCVLTPGANLGLASVNHDQTAVALASAYNAWMADTYYEYDRLRPTILVAHQRPSAAAEEIDRYGDEDPIAGVQIPASGLIPPAGHELYDPIYEAAEDHGLPVVLHSGNTSPWSTFPVQRYWAETFMEDHMFTFPAESMWHLVSMVCRGVPERFPDLEVVIQEAGVEWVPWMLWRFDDHYLQNSQDVPILRKPPSEYIRDQFYFVTQPLGHAPDAGHLTNVLEAAGGAETLMFATDHPHADFDPPEELFAPISRGLGEEDVRGMMGETAARVFGLPD